MIAWFTLVGILAWAIIATLVVVLVYAWQYALAVAALLLLWQLGRHQRRRRRWHG